MSRLGMDDKADCAGAFMDAGQPPLLQSSARRCRWRWQSFDAQYRICACKSRDELWILPHIDGSLHLRGRSVPVKLCVQVCLIFSPHFIAQILILFFKNFEYYMWIFKKFYETKSSCKKVFPISSWNTLIWKKSWKLNICLFIWTWLWKYFFRVLAVKIFLGF